MAFLEKANKRKFKEKAKREKIFTSENFKQMTEEEKKNIFEFSFYETQERNEIKAKHGYTEIMQWDAPTSVMSVYNHMNEMSVRKRTPPSLGFWPGLAQSHGSNPADPGR